MWVVFDLGMVVVGQEVDFVLVFDYVVDVVGQGYVLFVVGVMGGSEVQQVGYFFVVVVVFGGVFFEDLVELFLEVGIDVW